MFCWFAFEVVCAEFGVSDCAWVLFEVGTMWCLVGFGISGEFSLFRVGFPGFVCLMFDFNFCLFG